MLEFEWPTHCIHGKEIKDGGCSQCTNSALGTPRSRTGRFLQRLRRYSFRLLPMPLQVRLLDRTLKG
jgi:hypothetical protein